jgi:hypothetical protein
MGSVATHQKEGCVFFQLFLWFGADKTVLFFPSIATLILVKRQMIL